MPEDLSSGQDALLQPTRTGRDAKTPVPSGGASNRSNVQYFTPSIGGPGSFIADPKVTLQSRHDPSKPDLGSIANWPLAQRDEKEFQMASEQRQADFRDKIEREIKIKAGSENLLEALNTKNPKQTRDQRARVESELEISNRKLAQLRHELAEEIARSKESPPPIPGRLSQLLYDANTPILSRPSHEDTGESDDEAESPTFVLADLLQSIEREGMGPDYYVERSNSLVELLRRHPTLKYDLAWDIFGPRVQIMLLSESREVVASGFRLMRYAITDRKSLRIMRSFRTDEMVILSLVKEGKVSVEREQALKFVRAFLDVKNGAREIAQAIVRTIVAVAESHEDRMRNICLLTLVELVVLYPELAIPAGAMGVITNTVGEGMYHPSETIGAALCHLLDTPAGRQHLKSGHELGSALATFTDGTSHLNEDILKSSAKVISALLKSWSGLMALCMNDFMAIRSLSTSLLMPDSVSRDMVLELILDVLRIKPPSWSSSFLAGRRLTTYGRIGATHEIDLDKDKGMGKGEKQELVDHFVAAVLAAFLKSDLLEALMFVIGHENNSQVKRKATLLLSEILNMAHEMLPTGWTSEMQVLPDLFNSAAELRSDDRSNSTNIIYQIDSVHRTLHRTGHKPFSHGFDAISNTLLAGALRRPSELTRDQLSPNIDDATFRQVVVDSGVLTHHGFMKWKWDLIEKIVEGPLLNPKRLDEVVRTSKFMKRLTGFYRPFKYTFSDIRNTRPNQKYVRVGCILIKTLMSHPDGFKYLADNKLLPQIAECLAQVDRLSGLTSNAPLFSVSRMQDTLSGGYFAMLGAVSSNVQGLKLFERWRMANMFYHIIELKGRDDLIRAVLGDMDYTHESVLRVILSKALTSCSTNIRVFATRLLRKYACIGLRPTSDKRRCAEWAIDLLITQLYDTDVEVCEVAIKILEEACNNDASLEYVVQSRPMLDHLGETGAPLLLRFLSTSIGYHYLDDLDYISQEMDDWFLGRNDTYVAQVEASLAHAMSTTDRSLKTEEGNEFLTAGQAPPHFYRELARTAEGCRLLERKGHFEEFVSIIEKHGMEHDDPEVMIKVKGCLWAVGNIGSMELGAPFLESTNVVQMIVRIAEQSAVLSMRGTAIYILGLVSRTLHGQEILAQNGWDVAVDDMGNSTGICLPVNFTGIIAMRQWPDAGTQRNAVQEKLRDRNDVDDDDPVNRQILELVNDLSNTVLSKTRANDLMKIKAKRVPGFRDPTLFYKVMKILDRHHFRLPVLRFVMDLFDKEIMRKIMFEDYSDTEDLDDTLQPS